MELGNLGRWEFSPKTVISIFIYCSPMDCRFFAAQLSPGLWCLNFITFHSVVYLRELQAYWRNQGIGYFLSPMVRFLCQRLVCQSSPDRTDGLQMILISKAVSDEPISSPPSLILLPGNPACKRIRKVVKVFHGFDGIPAQGTPQREEPEQQRRVRG